MMKTISKTRSQPLPELATLAGANRKDELAEANRKIKKLERELKKQVEAVKTTGATIMELEKGLKDRTSEVTGLRIDLGRNAEELAKAGENIERLEKEVNAVKTTDAKIVQLEDALSIRLDAHLEAVKTTDAKIVQLEKGLNIRLDAHLEAVKTANKKIEALEKGLEDKSELKDRTSEVTGLRKDLEIKAVELAKAGEDIERLEKELTAVKFFYLEAVKTSDAKIEALEKGLEEKTSEVTEANEKIKSSERHLEDTTHELTKARDAIKCLVNEARRGAVTSMLARLGNLGIEGGELGIELTDDVWPLEKQTANGLQKQAANVLMSQPKRKQNVLLSPARKDPSSSPTRRSFQPNKKQKMVPNSATNYHSSSHYPRSDNSSIGMFGDDMDGGDSDRRRPCSSDDTYIQFKKDDPTHSPRWNCIVCGETITQRQGSCDVDDTEEPMLRYVRAKKKNKTNNPYFNLLKQHAFHETKKPNACRLWCVAAKFQHKGLYNPFQYMVSHLRYFCDDTTGKTGETGELTLSLYNARSEGPIYRVLLRRIEVTRKKLRNTKETPHERLAKDGKSQIEGDSGRLTTKNRDSFLEKCRAELESLWERLQTTISTENTHFREACANVTRAQFINDLNLAMSNPALTEGFFERYGCPKTRPRENNISTAPRADEQSRREIPREITALSASRREETESTEDKVDDSRVGCAAGELCGMKGHDISTCPHKCFKCQKKIHTPMSCGAARVEGGRCWCLKCGIPEPLPEDQTDFAISRNFFNDLSKARKKELEGIDLY